MGILLKTLFISVTLFMLFASSHEVILPKETFKHLVTSFAGGAKATPAWKHFYKSIHGKEARPM